MLASALTLVAVHLVDVPSNQTVSMDSRAQFASVLMAGNKDELKAVALSHACVRIFLTLIYSAELLSMTTVKLHVNSLCTVSLSQRFSNLMHNCWREGSYTIAPSNQLALQWMVVLSCSFFALLIAERSGLLIFQPLGMS